MPWDYWKVEVYIQDKEHSVTNYNEFTAHCFDFGQSGIGTNKFNFLSFYLVIYKSAVKTHVDNRSLLYLLIDVTRMKIIVICYSNRIHPSNIA